MNQICPLMSKVLMDDSPVGYHFHQIPCQKDGCTWWDSINSCCAAISLITEISETK